MIKSALPNRKCSQSGMILPMALILLVVASLIVVPGMMVMQNLMKINSGVEQDAMAYYAADAGVADLIWKYKYGTAPTASYILTGINNMSVDVSLLPQSTGQNYFWRASAPAGSSSKAEVFVNLQQSGSQGNDIFDQAAVALGGDITMSGGCKVVSDDIFIIDDCDSNWTLARTGVATRGTNTNILYRETGNYYDTGTSVSIAMLGPAGIENIAYKNMATAKNISAYAYVSAWIYSRNAGIQPGDFKFKIATNNALGGTVESYNIPAIPANTGTRVLFAVGNQSSFSALRSIGLYQAVDRGVPYPTLYFDEVIATNNMAKNGDIYANGNISIQPSAIVNGTASATGTISVSTGGGAKVWGVQTPSAPAYVPQAINIQTYIDLATGPGSTHYSTWPSSWTYGTHNLGPANFDHDISIGGSNTIVLTGDIYVRGNLTITGSAVVQGPYTIVADEITVNGASSAMLASGNIPLMIAQSGDFHISNSAQVSAIVYAPNGQLHITGNVGSNGYNLYGAAVAKSVVMEGSTQIKYLSGIRTMPWPPGWGLGGGAGGGGGTPTTTLLGYDYR
jgi:hypothetical protein